MQQGPIGVFDSGYGGLTVLKEMVNQLPQYNYLYLGDNARAPYGNRSFETVYQYTWQCVQWFFSKGCPLVILACNTASAKALRTIQQTNLPIGHANKKVLGVIRPTTEIIGNYTTTNHIGVLGTQGTVQSNSYPIEIDKFFPHIHVHQQACPMWVPLIENNAYNNEGANFFVQEYLQQLLQQNNAIDTVLLACTHYPLLLPQIQAYLPKHITVVGQGTIVANSLANYLQRHTTIEQQLLQQGTQTFYTTDSSESFNEKAAIFFGKTVESHHVDLEKC
jgi:glutamate racemase